MATKEKMCHPGANKWLQNKKLKAEFNKTGYCNWCGTKAEKPENVITCPHCKVNYCEKHFDEHLAINYKPHPLTFSCYKCKNGQLIADHYMRCIEEYLMGLSKEQHDQVHTVAIYKRLIEQSEYVIDLITGKKKL